MKREKSKYPGVYRRESAEKKFNGKSDLCFDITYKHEGKKIWEKCGWLSEGYSEKLASDIRAERIRSIRHGFELPKQKAKVPFLKDVWETYATWIKTNKARNGRDDLNLYNNHIKGRFGNRRMNEISTFDLERMKSELLKEGLAPATVKHCLVIIRQIYNKSFTWDLYRGGNPVKGLKMPIVQNQRQRFLSYEEAAMLLKELSAMQKPTLHDMAMLSTHTGLRAGEIFNLKGYDLDFQNDLIRITDPKNKMMRYADMLGTVKDMLERRRPQEPEGLVFPDRNGKKIVNISQSFRKVIKRLGFNNGITDRRQMVTFHSLRHTYASWLALQGESLITIRDMLGHKTTAMTERYSHLIADHKKRAAERLEAAFNGHKKKAEMKNEI